MNIDDFKKMVRLSRKTGYFQHDVRDPDKYMDSDAAIEVIRDFDKAFTDAANGLDFEFWEAGGFGESPQAIEVTDRIVDLALAVDDDGYFLQAKPNPYDMALPEFKAWMKQWRDNVDSKDLRKAEEYWSARE